MSGGDKAHTILGAALQLCWGNTLVCEKAAQGIVEVHN